MLLCIRFVYVAKCSTFKCVSRALPLQVFGTPNGAQIGLFTELKVLIDFLVGCIIRWHKQSPDVESVSARVAKHLQRDLATADGVWNGEFAHLLRWHGSVVQESGVRPRTTHCAEVACYLHSLLSFFFA